MTKKSPKKQKTILDWLKKNFYPTVCFKKNTQTQNVNTQLLTKLQEIMLMLQKIILTTLGHDSPPINRSDASILFSKEKFVFSFLCTFILQASLILNDRMCISEKILDIQRFSDSKMKNIWCTNMEPGSVISLNVNK